MSDLIHQLKPKIQTQKSRKNRKFTVFCDCGGNPLHLVIPALLISVKTTCLLHTFFNSCCTHTGLTSVSRHTRDGILSTMTHSYYLTLLSVVKHYLGYPQRLTMSVTVSSYFMLNLFYRQTQVSC